MLRKYLTNGHWDTSDLTQKALRYLREDAGFWWCISIMMAVYAVICLHGAYVNGWHEWYFKWVWPLAASPIILVMKWLDEQFKASLYILVAFAQFTIGFDIILYCTPILLTTTHHFIDHQLFAIDKWMHISVMDFVNITNSHPFFHKIMFKCYALLDKTYLLLIFFLAIMGEKKDLNRLLIIMLIGAGVAGLVFYFFPAFGPNSIFHTNSIPRYDELELPQYHNVLKGINPFKTHYYAGFVSIPSIHCYAASLGIYTIFKNAKTRILLAPLAIVDAGVVASTMFLGEHYFIDLIVAWALLAITIFAYNYIAKLCTQRQSYTSNAKLKISQVSVQA
jgi:membrane-associated phospholipid phosphatase